MSSIKKPKIVKLICGVLFQSDFDRQKIKVTLEENFGAIDYESDDFPFDFSNYYRDEMGGQLLKQFFSFSKLIYPDAIVQMKLKSNALEESWAITNKRQVNLDPGYVTGAKMVLATTKNFAHRVYIGDGIYGDNHLRYIHGKWVSHEWTYPDYQTPLAIEFFSLVRKQYLKQTGQE